MLRAVATCNQAHPEFLRAASAFADHPCASKAAVSSAQLPVVICEPHQSTISSAIGDLSSRTPAVSCAGLVRSLARGLLHISTGLLERLELSLLWSMNRRCREARNRSMLSNEWCGCHAHLLHGVWAKPCSCHHECLMHRVDLHPTRRPPEHVVSSTNKQASLVQGCNPNRPARH